MDSIVIDGNNFTLIAYAASNKINTDQSPEEKLTTVLYGMLKKLKNNLYGDYYVCWDTYGGTEFRHQLDPNYKANRDHDRFDFETVERCKYIYKLMKVEPLSIPECEGDDAIFALCKALRGCSSDQITVVSADQDLQQVVQAGYADQIWNPRKGRVEEIPTYSVVQFKALAGDKSDNISGVSGIGPKKALAVLNGEIRLTESQQTQYETSLKIVDARLNPYLENNYRVAREFLESLGKVKTSLF